MAFGFFGIIFIVYITLVGLSLQFPPHSWQPCNWEPKKSSVIQCCNINRSEMIRTRSFWGLWLCYVIGTLAGLMAIGIASSVGQEINLLSAPTAAAFTGLFSAFNGIGRLLFGVIVDKVTFRATAILTLGVIFVATILLESSVGTGMTIVYFVGFAALCLNLGGWLAIAPACTASFFGTKYYRPNYGLVYTVYGIEAVTGSQLVGRMRDIVGSYNAVFLSSCYFSTNRVNNRILSL